ncbi:MAG TPA: hypothetical protein VD948_13295, partial [Rhodothermales bacterium]|nr:hypothetical protein [Rhodothermales bacterium]
MPSRLLLGARVRRMACWLVAFVLGLARGAAAQNFAFHGSISSDDGDQAKDANGALNGMVMWTPGKVHVLQSYNAN